MIRTLVVAVAVLCAQAATASTVETWDFRPDLGTLRKAASGVPRVQTQAAAIARDRWQASAESFSLAYTAPRGARGTESFTTWRVDEDGSQAHIRLNQSIAGLPVVGAQLIVHADLASGKVVGVNGIFAVDRDLPRRAEMGANDAIENAIAEYGLYGARVEGPPELTYVIDGNGETRLAWSNYVSYSSENGYELDIVFADALTGAAIARHAQIARAKNREMYNCHNQGTWSNCTFMFGEGGSSTDLWATAAYNQAGIVYDYFWNTFGQDSTNDAGAPIKQAVHLGSSSNNAAGWLASPPWTAIGYGDAGSVAASPVSSLDVVAHEITHGLARQMIGLVLSGESHAIHEGVSDVFGATTERWAHDSGLWQSGLTNYGLWSVGEDSYSSPLRYLNDPRQKGTSYKDYYPKRNLGGTHVNAGLTGLPFYLLAQGGMHPRGETSINVSAQGITTAEQIFFKGLVYYGYSSMGFRRWRQATLQAATSLYGSGSAQYTATFNAWAAVGNHWDEQHSSLLTGGTWISPAYTTTKTSYNTGFFAGPSGFHLILEFWDVPTSTWKTHTSVLVGANKLIEDNAYLPAGQYRWRIFANSGSGPYSFWWNHSN